MGQDGRALAGRRDWFRPAPVVVDNTAEFDRRRQALWSWQPIRKAAPPLTKETLWSRGDIDRFVLAKLEQKGLKPSAAADKLTLIRRATFDLTGLPPTPSEVEAFSQDGSASAFEHVVDRLLASPRFGERWGRHWLDVARYAESCGMTRNFPYYFAWRYRDYVIDAFNRDEPFDRFVTEQLAGDLLPASTPAERDQLRIATGFLCLGTRDLNEKNLQQYTLNNIDEQIDVTGRALLGMTIACARCHDHKFDPIPTKEYYSLAGIFRSTNTYSGLNRFKIGGNLIGPDQFMKLSGYHDPNATFALSDDEQENEATALLRKAQATRSPAAAMAALQASLRRIAQTPAPSVNARLAMGVEEGYPADMHILGRGELENMGPVAPRGFLSIPAMGTPPSVDPAHSGRLELARWVTRSDNPLTPRVLANRVWAHLFGEGIVRTVDNFGEMGDRPTHPELLDYLAARVVENGWSVKKLIREVMLTSAYQQSSAFDKAKYAVDPDDHTLWRMRQRRLEAEAIRDAMMAVSGDLNLSQPTGSLVLSVSPREVFRAERMGGGLQEDWKHRSVYLPIYRNFMPEALEVFDVADPDMVSGQRDVTTVAPQALFMMNNENVIAESHHLAEKVLADAKATEPARIDRIYKLALGRAPTPAERNRAISFISAATREGSPSATAAKRTEDAVAEFCQAIFAAAEFRYVN